MRRSWTFCTCALKVMECKTGLLKSGWRSSLVAFFPASCRAFVGLSNLVLNFAIPWCPAYISQVACWSRHVPRARENCDALTSLAITCGVLPGFQFCLWFVGLAFKKQCRAMQSILALNSGLCCVRFLSAGIPNRGIWSLPGLSSTSLSMSNPP